MKKPNTLKERKVESLEWINILILSRAIISKHYPLSKNSYNELPHQMNRGGIQFLKSRHRPFIILCCTNCETIHQTVSPKLFTNFCINCWEPEGYLQQNIPHNLRGEILDINKIAWELAGQNDFVFLTSQRLAYEHYRRFKRFG